MSDVSEPELRKIAHSAILEAARKLMQAATTDQAGSRGDCYHDALEELRYARENVLELQKRARAG